MKSENPKLHTIGRTQAANTHNLAVGKKELRAPTAKVVNKEDRPDANTYSGDRKRFFAIKRWFGQRRPSCYATVLRCLVRHLRSAHSI
jgi:hypothetical protein